MARSLYLFHSAGSNAKELKPADYELLFELIKNSHRSDRQLAKVLRISQPTITRRRKLLEKDFIQEYTAIPKFEKIGYGLIAFTFVKSALREATLEQKKEAIAKGKEWAMKQPCVVFALYAQGMGWDGLAISFHNDYSGYVAFMRKLRTEASEFVIECESFLSLLTPESVIKPPSLKYLAKMEKRSP